MTLLTVRRAPGCYSLPMDNYGAAGSPAWDAYAVWQILLHRHPVLVENPADSCGRIDRGLLVEFCETICDYPDYLQDTLLLLAHARGVEASAQALDDAVREHLGMLLQRRPEVGQGTPAS